MSASNTKFKYERKQQVKDNEQIDDHEIRVTSKGSASRYIARAAVLFLEKEYDHVILKATGGAISILCIATEVIRRRIKGLH